MPMHAVIPTPTFLTDASAAGLSEDDQQVIVTAISEDLSWAMSCPERVDAGRHGFPEKEKGSVADIERFTTSLRMMCQCCCSP